MPARATSHPEPRLPLPGRHTSSSRAIPVGRSMPALADKPDPPAPGRQSRPHLAKPSATFHRPPALTRPTSHSTPGRRAYPLPAAPRRLDKPLRAVPPPTVHARAHPADKPHQHSPVDRPSRITPCSHQAARHTTPVQADEPSPAEQTLHNHAALDHATRQTDPHRPGHTTPTPTRPTDLAESRPTHATDHDQPAHTDKPCQATPDRTVRHTVPSRPTILADPVRADKPRLISPRWTIRTHSCRQSHPTRATTPALATLADRHATPTLPEPRDRPCRARPSDSPRQVTPGRRTVALPAEPS